MVYLLKNDSDRKLVILNKNMVVDGHERDLLDQEISWNRSWWLFYTKMVIFDQNPFATWKGFWILKIKATGEWNIFNVYESHKWFTSIFMSHQIWFTDYDSWGSFHNETFFHSFKGGCLNYPLFFWLSVRVILVRVKGVRVGWVPESGLEGLQFRWLKINSIGFHAALSISRTLFFNHLK